MNKKLFDKNLCNNLREVINRTNIFIKDEYHSKKFNLICAVMDRFDTAIEYFNEHNEIPKTEIEFMTYLMQIAIIKDGIDYCFDVLGMDKITDNKIFKKYYERDLKCLNNEMDDDGFFEYFRSLSFAHPFLTNKSIPKKKEKDEKQYSPYCLLDLHGLRKDENAVGVYVYSNKRPPFSITFPFETIKEYASWKFGLIQNIIDAFENIIKNIETEWRKHKVNRSLNEIDILKDIRNILKERYMECYTIDEIIGYLTCNISETDNLENVNKFRNEIIKLIPELCDAVDEFRNDDIYYISYKVINVRPNAHPMMHYQLEKVFCYLNTQEYSDVEWGLKMAEVFSKEFAKKWVIIKPYEMNFQEIKLLVCVACYLEYQEQNMKGGK